ncbi:MAG TPA: branched-chain amino acid aminotransferase [Phycisphaerae bacterium]|nr:branched-chain amino acid aminotransferase [Phycisphaerae bacterium]
MAKQKRTGEKKTEGDNRPQRVVYLNGEYVPETEAKISIFDSALMFGDMVFEMTRSYRRKQFKLREHLERLYRSIKMLRIPVGMTIDEMEKLTYEVIERNRPAIADDDEDRVMINVSRGPLSLYWPIFEKVQPTVVISVFPLSWTMGAAGDLYDTGIHAVTPSQRAIPAHLLEPKMKNRSRLHYQMANLQVSLVADPNAWALLLDPDGYVTEGTGSNFFLIRDGELLTPEPRNILRGITRAHTMHLARQKGIVVRECNIEPYDVINGDEAFVTSTPFMIIPCTKFNGIPIGTGQVGAMTRKLQDAWSEDIGYDVFAQARELSQMGTSEASSGPSTYRFIAEDEK